MRKVFAGLAAALFFCLASAATASAQPDAGPRSSSFAFTNVTVIDATGARPRRGMTVVVEGGRIAEIGPAGRIKVPAGARTFDAAGKFLIPGLWDMHAHVWDGGMLFPAYVANGVTGVRDMGGVLEQWAKWRAQVEAGETAGPRAAVAGKIVDGFKPFFYFFVQAATADEGRATVCSLAGKGADFIKVYDRLPRETYFAVADEARRHKLTFAGHVPVGVKASEAASAGQRSVEHLTGIALESSADEARLRADAVAALDAARAEGLKPEELRARFRRYYELSRYTPLDTYSESKAKKLFAHLRRHNTWQVPTLVVREDFGDERIRQEIAPRLRYFPAYVRGMILPEGRATDAERAENLRRFRKEIEIVRAMRKSGVRFLAGSDAPNPYSVPGFGLHDELSLLVSAGFTPMEALQAATRDAAEFLGRLDSFGTVERGKTADLVLLDADPLADIRHTRRIAAVVLGGRLFTKAELDAMLEALAARANKN